LTSPYRLLLLHTVLLPEKFQGSVTVQPSAIAGINESVSASCFE
jgi:hypothetical protein